MPLQTAKDRDGRTIRVGSRVTCFSIYTGEPMNTVTVTRIERQGADGTIVTTEPAPSNEYPNHKAHRASKCSLQQSSINVVNQPTNTRNENIMASTKTTKTTKTTTKKNRTVIRLTKDGKKLSLNQNGLSVSAYLIDGTAKTRGKAESFATHEEAAAHLSKKVAQAEGAGWELARKVRSMDDLIG